MHEQFCLYIVLFMLLYILFASLSSAHARVGITIYYTRIYSTISSCLSLLIGSHIHVTLTTLGTFAEHDTTTL